MVQPRVRPTRPPPLAMKAKKGFLPIDDRGQFEVIVRLPEGRSVAATELVGERVARIVRAMKTSVHPGTESKAPTDVNEIIRKHPAVAHYTSFIGGGTLNTGNAFIDFIHRTADGAEIYFLANRNGREESATCTFRGAGVTLPRSYDPRIIRRKYAALTSSNVTPARWPLVTVNAFTERNVLPSSNDASTSQTSFGSRQR